MKCKYFKKLILMTGCITQTSLLCLYYSSCAKSTNPNENKNWLDLPVSNYIYHVLISNIAYWEEYPYMNHKVIRIYFPSITSSNYSTTTLSISSYYNNISYYNEWYDEMVKKGLI